MDEGGKARRLARAVRELECEQRGDGSWCVTGGADPQVVDPDAGTCSCKDYLYRRGVCAHLLRVRLALGDPATLRALGQLVTPPKRGSVHRTSTAGVAVHGLVA